MKVEKPISLEGDPDDILERVDESRKAKDAHDRAQIKAWIASRTPSGGFPTKTIEAANEELHITADMRRDAPAHARAITESLPKRDRE